MPRYYPLDVHPDLDCNRSNLLELRWTNEAVVADFLIPDDDDHMLRVQFRDEVIVRILDEMALSTEHESTPKEGLVANHFGYRVEGAVFESTQSETWRSTRSPATHYRFVTGWACVDILSASEPSFEVINRVRISERDASGTTPQM